MQRREPKWPPGDPDRYEKYLRNPAAYNKRAKQIAQKQALNNYDVGYGRPPTHSQFKAGQSGNPLGRALPKKRTLRDAIEEILTDKITIRKGGKTRKVTMLEAVILRSLNQALKGDQKAIRAVYTMSMALGLLDERPQKLELNDLSSLTTSEVQELRRLLKKACAEWVPT